jgi:hypothetical protein
MPFSTVLGVVLGVFAVLAMPSWVGPVREAYDSIFPVLQMKGVLVDRQGSAVMIHIQGRKLRGEECRLLHVYGYAIQQDGRLSDATATRIDQPIDGRTRDAGFYDIGIWRVQPVDEDATGVKVVTQHDCVGRVVLSTIAEVTL